MEGVKKVGIITKLQDDIFRLQGFKTASHTTLDLGLDAIKQAFPNGTFSLSAVHEFISDTKENAAATAGFISGLLSTVIKCTGTLLWITSSHQIFPPALKTYGIEPERCIFIFLSNEKDVQWAMEEALKSSAITAVIAEMKALNFTASRRLQLAVEQSHVTGFIIRNNIHKLGTTASVARWKISPIASKQIDDLPGVGYPSWKVELLRVRNGKPGTWTLSWKDGAFVPVINEFEVKETQQKKAG